MTMKVTGRKASLYATAMAISLVALSGAAHAQTRGTFATLPAEAVGGAKTTTSSATLTDAQIAASTALNTPALKVAATKKNAITAQLNSALSASSKAAYDAAKAAIADEDAKRIARAKADATLNGGTVSVLAGKLVANGTAGATVTIVAASSSAVQRNSDANSAVNGAGGLLEVKIAADSSVTSKQGAVADKQALLNAALAATVPVPADITNARAALARAQEDLNIALAGQTSATSNYNAGVALAAARATALSTATTNFNNADAALNTAIQVNSQASGTLSQALAADTAFGSKLTAVKAAALADGVSVANDSLQTASADFAGLLAIDAFDNQSLSTNYASNGSARAAASLAAAAASTNANIALASGALTGSDAALEVGAAFETEVLSVLVNHETRITTNATNIAANTTAIAALDVRTTANTTAIAALDVRTTANTTAIANEVTARVAADNALGARITAETDARIAADNVLRDQIASSTATAIAMGGAALLPDMGFTLSGNIAVYEGAQAMALNAAAKVGANAYVTAAVGGGLNKNGSVGGRVGFVFGF